MTGIAPALRDFLDDQKIDYEVVHHHTDHTARQTAWDTHTPPNEFAKTVFVWIDDVLSMAVVPADQAVSEHKLALALQSAPVRLAAEEEFEGVCDDCEIGAEPPFGNLYDLPVYASSALGESEHITFNGGTHQEAVRMSYRDFIRLVEPQVVPLARHD